MLMGLMGYGSFFFFLPANMLLYTLYTKLDLDTNEDFEKEYEKYRSVFKEITKQEIDDFSVFFLLSSVHFKVSNQII